MSGEKPPSIQLVDGQGNFNEVDLDSFVKTVGLTECGLSYAVVSIMGPQSSGKSTLLNHLFGTNFREMDAFRGRSQTTQGIWLAKAKNIHPLTLVMDLEGTDGRERGEDETTFEKQSSLFALAVSDIVLINMWCHDIGREQAANKPLLKTVFQVMMRLFTPRKSTLLFVIRDKTKTPLEVLERILREDVQKIWDSVPKPAKHQTTPITEFFNVQVTALPSYEEKEEQFLEQVDVLRERFMNSIAPGGLAGDRRAVVPGSGFPFSINEIWRIIKENKDLDLPAHKVMVATVRCEAIANEKLMELASNEEWKTLEEDCRTSIVPGFGRKLNNILNQILSRYDAEAAFFDEGVRTAKRHLLLKRSAEMLYPAYQATLTHHRTRAFEKFRRDLEQSSKKEGFADQVLRCSETCMAEFERGCEDAHVAIAGWDFSKIREKLRREVDAHAASVRAEKLEAIASEFEKRVEKALVEPVAALLDAATPDTWTAIKKLLVNETESAVADLSVVLSGFGLEKDEKSKMVSSLKEFGRRIVEKKARDEASQVLLRMKERFNSVFSHGPDSMPRVWTGKEDMKAIIHDARLQAIKLLSILSALRLEEKKKDNIETSLTSLLTEGSDTSAQSGTTERSLTAQSALAASTWEGVPESETLITPVQCRSLWRQFNREIEYTITQAIAAQEASKRSNSWLPPPWAIVAMVFLGFNEFMMLLRNPLYLIVMFVLFLLGRAVWVQLDIEREFQGGFLMGIISVSARLVPTFMNFLKKLAEEGQQMANSQSFNASSTASSGNYTSYSQAPYGQVEMTSFGDKGEDSAVNGGSHENSLRQRQQAKLVS